MSAGVPAKKDYVSHHLPNRTINAYVGDDKKQTTYTSSAAPKSTRGMTAPRLIAAGLIIIGHIVSVFCIYDLIFNLDMTGRFQWFGLTFLLHFLTGVPGITAGVHRLWAHRSYKAKWPARLILAICNTVANQSSILHWAVEHRVHHRHSDTDADPHNITRGFFYCHMGWLFTPRTDAFIAARREIDDSDLKADPIVYYQDKYYPLLGPLFCHVLPGFIGSGLMDDYWRGVAYLGFFRWIITLHITWCVNSVAHTFGTRPYRPNEKPTEIAPVSFFSGGEGWHNYHHAFPWDYAATEDRTDIFWRYNVARAWIDAFALIGWVTERKVQRNAYGVPLSRPEEAPVPADFHHSHSH